MSAVAIRNGLESFLGASCGVDKTSTKTSSTWEYCKDERRVGGQFAPHVRGRRKREVCAWCLGEGIYKVSG